jgi:hypothetical protein
MRTALPDGARGRALAMGITLAALALLWFGLVAPLVAWHADQQDALERQAVLRDRMRGLAATVPALRRDLEAAGSAPGHAEAALEGAGDAVAAANLQQTLDELAKAAEVRIGSSETLPTEPAGAWQAITVRVTLTAPWPPLVRLLQSIAASPTTMVVDNMQLRPPPRDTKDRLRPIDASFSVTGWRSVQGQPGQDQPK